MPEFIQIFTGEINAKIVYTRQCFCSLLAFQQINK